MKRLYRFLGFVVAVAVLSLSFSVGKASAIPSLQLDIGGGVYSELPYDDTIITTSSTFTLYAYLYLGPGAIHSNPSAADPLWTDTFYISVALTPKTAEDPTLDLGSFDFGTTTVAATDTGMTYGTAPIDAFLQGWDAHDLQKHSIFPTYFYEHAFQFSSAQTTPYNTQDNSGGPVSPGSGMYYVAFDIDRSLLDGAHGLHFDLYNKTTSLSGDTDISQFAPFSKDAESIPEPATVILLGAGLLGFALYRRESNSLQS